MKSKKLWIISFFGTAVGIIAGYIFGKFIPEHQLGVTAAVASTISAILMED